MRKLLSMFPSDVKLLSGTPIAIGQTKTRGTKWRSREALYPRFRATARRAAWATSAAVRWYLAMSASGGPDSA